MYAFARSRFSPVRSAMSSQRLPSLPERTSSSLADVLVPELRIRCDELRHQSDAGVVLKDLNGDSALSQEVLFAHERSILSDDDPWNAVQQNRTGTHRARRERCVDDRLAIDGSRLSSGVLECVYLAMQCRAASLDAAIVAPANDRSAMHDHRSDRNPALAQSLLGLGDGSEKEGVRHGADRIASVWGRRPRRPAARE